MSLSFSLLDAAYAAARWGWYVAAFLLLGAGSYAPFLFRVRTGLHSTDPDFAAELSRRAARIGSWAAVSLLGFTLVRFWCQARVLNEPGEPLTGDFLRAVLNSAWGHGWQRQLMMGVLAAVAFAAARSGSRFGWMVATAASGGVGFTLGMTGHASSTVSAGPSAVLLDAIHVWAGGLWLGGLAVLLIAGFAASRRLSQPERTSILRALVADFSRRALLLAPLAIGFGIWLAARYLGWSWPLHLFESSYGWVLAGKLAVLAAVGAVGAYNWRVTQPGLASEGGDLRLRRFSKVELWCGAIVLAITAILVSLPFPEGRM